jgi:hypothetical protein
MSKHIVRRSLALLLLCTLAFHPARAQAYKHGFCMGIAGVPPVNYVTRAFVLGSTSVDLAAFRNDLEKNHGGNVRIDATGCRMFPTAAETAGALRQLLEQSRTMSFKLVSVDWLPEGASALPAGAPDPGASAKPSSPASSGHP